MELVDVLLVISFIIGVVVSGFLIIKNRRNKSFRYLSISLLFASIWPMTILLTLKTGNNWIAHTSFSVCVLMILNILLFFNEFASTWPKKIINLFKYFTYLSVAISLVPGSISKQIAIDDGSIRLVEAGPFFWFYYLYYLIYLSAIVYLANRAYRNVSGIKKRQLVYIGVGFAVSLLAAVVLNLVLPAFGYYQFNGLGPVFMLIVLIFAVYSATRHYLYEPRVLLYELYAILLSMVSIVRLVMYPYPSSYILSGLTVGLCFLFVKAVINGAEVNLQLKKDKAELVRLDRMKDEFLMVATHELNTPVTVLEGKVGMIVNEGFGNFSDEQKAYLRPIFDNSKKLSRLFGHILEVVKIDENRLALKKSTADLVSLVNKSVAYFDDRSKKAKITFDAPKKEIFINADTEKLTEAIIHIIDNAVKFSCVGNRCGIVKVGIKASDSEAIVWVEDNGIGIAKEDQKRISEKFFQSKRFDSKAPSEQQGSGLALYISRKIVEMHHGRIWLDSTEGKGTRFSIALSIKS